MFRRLDKFDGPILGGRTYEGEGGRGAYIRDVNWMLVGIYSGVAYIRGVWHNCGDRINVVLRYL